MKIGYDVLTMNDIDNNELWNDFIFDGDKQQVFVKNYGMDVEYE